MRDITNNDFTVMESNSEDFYAFRIDTGPYKDVIFRFGKVSGKDTSTFGKDAKFGILAGKVLKHMLETSITDLKESGQL